MSSRRESRSTTSHPSAATGHLAELQALTSHRDCPICVPVQDLTLAAKAFADPTRVRVLAALRPGELCVCELADSLTVTQSTLSTHLRVIRDAGLVSARKQGKWMYYAIAPGAGRLVAMLFDYFAVSLKQDKALVKDGQRLQRRLAMRDHGACCVGFADSKKKCRQL